MAINYTLAPVSTSALADGTTGGMVYNPTMLTIGGVAPNLHALLRFNASSIPTTEIIVSTTLRLKAAGKAGTSPDVAVWASAFDTTITYADYNQSASNSNTAGTLRVQLSTTASPAFSGTSSVASDVASVVIPSRYVTKGAGGFADFELRPAVATTVGNNFVVYGPASAVGDAPQLLITTITKTENDAQNAYRWQAVGAESYCAFDIETTAGTPVKAKTMLECTSNGLDSDAENLVSAAYSQNRARPRKVAVGQAGAGGSISFEFTPEKCWRLLPGLMKKTLTADNGDGTYTHTFKAALSNEIVTYTFVSKVGAFRFVYPGCMISSFNISAGLDRVVTGDIGVMARYEYMYDYKAAGTNDEYILSGSAAYDSATNGLLSFVGADVWFNDVQDRGLVQDFNLSLAQDVRARRGLARKRGVTSHFPGGFTASVSFNMYFENENRMRAFLGINDTDFPTGAEKNIIFEKLLFVCRGAVEDDQVYEFEIPKVMYTTIRKPVNGEGEVMLSCSGVAVYNESDLSNIIVRITNSEPGTVFDASTDTITVLPNTSIG